jgi:hypothetical protein
MLKIFAEKTTYCAIEKGKSILSIGEYLNTHYSGTMLKKCH